VAERRIHAPSFVVGLLALTFAGLYLLDHFGGATVDEYIIAASTLIALGLAGVVASARRLLRQRESDEPG
jgi:hypothetical protein